MKANTFLNANKSVLSNTQTQKQDIPCTLKKTWNILLWSILLMVGAAIVYFQFLPEKQPQQKTIPFLVFDAEGNPHLSPERIAKRDKELEGIRNKPRPRESCEVYALVARDTRNYPCYNCGNQTSIILNRGEVWKYGKTCVGQNERYTENYLDELNLDFLTLYIGNENDCLVKEKELIYAYPTLPECKRRDFILLRPPGNKIDR